MRTITRKALTLLSLALLYIPGQAQDTSSNNVHQGWIRLQVDSFVSIEVPAAARQEKIQSTLLFAIEDSCSYIVQTALTEGELMAKNFRKSIIDQHIGQGFNLLADREFVLQGKPIVDMKFLDDINNLEKAKMVNYVRAFSIRNKLYTVIFSVTLANDSAMTTRKDAFFDSMQLHNLPVQTQGANENLADSSESGNNLLWVYISAALVLSLAFAMAIVMRKKKKS